MRKRFFAAPDCGRLEANVRCLIVFAIIKSGGKQYRAEEGATFRVDRLSCAPGDKVEITDVLLFQDGEKVLVGSPTVTGCVVVLETLEHCRDDKVIVFKKRQRTNYRRKGGHKQHQSKVKVLSIRFN